MDKEKSGQTDSHSLNNRRANEREEQPRQNRPRKKRVDEGPRKSVTFKWSWDLDTRLGHYVVDRSRKELRDVDRAKVVAAALDEFLSKEGY